MHCNLRDVMGNNHTIETRDVNTFMTWLQEFIPEIIQNGFGDRYPWTIDIMPSDPNEQFAMGKWNHVAMVLNSTSLAKSLRELADQLDKPAEETPDVNWYPDPTDPDSTELEQDDGTS